MLIDNRYKIESDPLNFTLYSKHTTKKGRETWHLEGYFSAIKQALHHLVELGVSETKMKDFVTIAKKQEELHNLIETLGKEK